MIRIGSITAGVAAGIVAALLLMPAAGDAIGRLAEARRTRAALAIAADAPRREPPQLVADGQAFDRPQALAQRLRALGAGGGVLVEQVQSVAAPGRGLAAVRLRVSGPEKAMLGYIDSVEREAPLVRLRDWRVEAIAAGGLRLEAEAIAPWR